MESYAPNTLSEISNLKRLVYEFEDIDPDDVVGVLYGFNGNVAEARTTLLTMRASEHQSQRESEEKRKLLIERKAHPDASASTTNLWELYIS
jgi:hypothetical protein